MEIKAAQSKVEKDERGGSKESLCNTFNSFTVKKRKRMGQLEGKVVSRVFIHGIYKSMFDDEANLIVDEEERGRTCW